jgi:hypothetical protein
MTALILKHVILFSSKLRHDLTSQPHHRLLSHINLNRRFGEVLCVLQIRRLESGLLYIS